uniref:Hylambatin n=1 Tax=Phlyctimantis maculatus TaxID=2517390 RepID=TKN2_PHLMA|nr:RecName: Full=Hylambatin [Kassina cochranae]prf//0801196B kassinin,2-Glu 5-Pro [Kassina cochranae]
DPPDPDRFYGMM